LDGRNAQQRHFPRRRSPHWQLAAQIEELVKRAAQVVQRRDGGCVCVETALQVRHLVNVASVTPALGRKQPNGQLVIASAKHADDVPRRDYA
jgi:hypothetical protein